MKMKNKKIKNLFIMLIMCLSLIIMTACTSKNNDSNKESSKNEKTDSDINFVGTKNIVDCTQFDGEYILVDNDKITIKVTGFDDSYKLLSETAFCVELSITNHMSEKIRVEEWWSDVNGLYDVSLVLNEVVEPGKTKTGSMFVSYDDLKAIDDKLNTITSILSRICAYTESESKTIYDDYLLIYPEGVDSAKMYNREKTEDDICILSNEYMDVFLIKPFVEKISSRNIKYGVQLYIVNKTDKYLCCYTINNNVENGEKTIYCTVADAILVGPKQRVYGDKELFDDDDLEDINLESFDISTTILTKEYPDELSFVKDYVDLCEDTVIIPYVVPEQSE